MSKKVEVRGDVAQLIGGNVQEAPRQNNVVNFNLGSEKGPSQTLTDLQRKRIGGLVRELCSITQEETLDVYRVILTEFGAERMRDMPRDKYHDVVAQLERWIAENKQGAQKDISAASAITANEIVPAASATAYHCDACHEKNISYSRLMRISRGQWVLSVVLAVFCGLLLYRMPSPSDAFTSTDQQCLFEGKPYSLGSIIKGTAGTLRECAVSDSSKMTMWTRTK